MKTLVIIDDEVFFRKSLSNFLEKQNIYEIAGEEYRSCGDYAVYMFHDRYDIPVKAADHERVGESEEVFEYLICIFAPVSGDYEPGQPECDSSTRHSATEAATGTMWIFIREMRSGRIMNCARFSGYRIKEK